MCENVSRRTGAVSIKLSDGSGAWCHISQRKSTVKYRTLAGDDWLDLDADGIEEMSPRIPAETCKWLLNNCDDSRTASLTGSLSYLNTQFWNEFFAFAHSEDGRVKVSQSIPPEVAIGDWMGARDEPAEPHVVPGTALRKCYDELRGCQTADVVAMAGKFAAEVTLVVDLWESSYESFKDYRYAEKWSVGARNPLPDPPKHIQNAKCTRSLVAYIKAYGLTVGGPAAISWDFVERELAPRSTPGGIYENGESARSSGHGGVDLLLVAKRNGQIEGSPSRPVITELKVGADANAFVALIQVLTYAVEFATPSQLQRLRNSYPRSFGETISDRVDVAIIQINRPSLDPTLGAVSTIISRLNEAPPVGMGTVTLLNYPVGDGVKTCEVIG